MIGLGLVVFVHERGHFLIANKVDIKVERFALGFCPRLFGFRKGETNCRVNLIPLGGCIKLLGLSRQSPRGASMSPTPSPTPGHACCKESHSCL